MDDVRAAIEGRLPRPTVELSVLVPYDRGDLVARVHQRGEVVATDHGDEGTVLRVRVDEVLAAELARYVVTVSSVGGNVR
jgi:GTP-binding protein HflX